MSERRDQVSVLDYNGNEVPVELEFRERKRLSISVHPDGSVSAIAPLDRAIEEVVDHIERRRPWIVRQRRYFEQFHPRPEPKRYVSGESHLYLGRQYRLRLRRADEPSVKLIGGYFDVQVPEPTDRRAVADVMESWYRSHAAAIFEEKLKRCQERASSLRFENVQLRIQRMKTRWGSCSRSGTVTLNIDLVKTPVHCIEYVILHELCHLRTHDHSPAFFRALGRHMPDWRQVKQRLDGFALR